MDPKLSYRKVTEEDVDELMTMRRACGWGEDKVPKFISRTLAGDEMVIFIFQLPCEDGTSRPQPVGMGGLQFTPLDGSLPDLSNAEEKKVQVSALFVYEKFNGKGFGREIMSILERTAIEEYGAKTLTVGTRPYNDDDSENQVMAWYIRLGYQEFRERKAHLRNFAGGPLLLGAFLSKEVGVQS